VESIAALRQGIASVFFGNPLAVDRIVCCLLARGHLLIEDVPGVGKTILAQAIARSVRCSFSRIQCTPDLLPTDITGTAVLDRASGSLSFRPGPVFANIVLADEINRATPRTQSALLEAMGEGTVTAEGQVHALPAPFLVVGTQNPSDFNGTFLLPENQLDRFLMRISLGYPAADDEAQIILQQPARSALLRLQPVLDAQQVLELQSEVDAVRIDPSLVSYIISIAHATRQHPQFQLGVSPRGALALAQASRAAARFAGRDYLVPEDIVDSIEPVCAHRVVLRSGGSGDASARIVQLLREVLESITSPA
jgi:MoxR-like ATPase